VDEVNGSNPFMRTMKNIIPNISLSIQIGILIGALLGSFFVLQSVWIIATIPFIICIYWLYRDIRLLALLFSLLVMIGFGYYVNNIITQYNNIQAKIPTKLESIDIIIQSSSKIQSFGYQYKVYIPEYQAKAFMTISNADLEYGDKLNVNAKTSIPDERGIKRFLLGRNIHSYMTVSKYEKLDPIQCQLQCYVIKWITNIRNIILNKIDTNYPNQVGEFLKGILIGYTDTLPSDIKESFKKTGVSHVLAVSGYNMAIIVMLVYQQLINRQISRKISFWITIISIIIFTLLTGAEASIMRAGIFAMLIITAEQLQRYVGGMRPLVLCATILVLINPLYIAYDIGFQLSFLAVIGLIIYGQVFKTYTEGIPSLGILPMIGETLFAQLLVLPILIYYFGQISIISILANILIVPIIPLAMAWGSITSLLLSWPIFTYPLVIIIQLVLGINQYLANISWASIKVPQISGFMLILIYVFFGVIYFWYMHKKKYEN
jgi:competence protein ComEC